MIDDDNQNYLDQIQEKQAKFKHEFEQKLAKNGFEFKYSTPSVSKCDDEQHNEGFERVNMMDQPIHKGIEDIADLFA